MRERTKNHTGIADGKKVSSRERKQDENFKTEHLLHWNFWGVMENGWQQIQEWVHENRLIGILSNFYLALEKLHQLILI